MGRILGLLCGMVGLVVGVVTAANYLFWLGHFPGPEDLEAVPMVLHFVGGPFSVLALPIAYGFGGLIGGAFIAALYNVLARWFGGIHVEIGQDPRFFSADFE